MTRGIGQNGIQRKLVIAFLLLGIVPMATMGVISYQKTSQALLNQTYEEMQNMTGKEVERLDTLLMLYRMQMDSLIIPFKARDLVKEMTAASEQQAQGIEQINRAVAEMDKVVQKNAASAEESASASEEMSAQAEKMKGIVGELISLVDGANEKVSAKPSSQEQPEEFGSSAAT